MSPIEQIAVGCGGAKRTARGFICRCPAHEDRTPSLSLGHGDRGGILVYCFGGCASEDVIAALRARSLWPLGGLPVLRATRTVIRSDPGRSTNALRTWAASQSAKNSGVQTYLASRGIACPIPPSIRSHLGLKHPSGSTWPAMVALITGVIDEQPVAIHRTFLARDGISKAPVDPAKMMLGPCVGGVVRLGGQSALLLIGEGIETCLSAQQATGHRTWAALSTSGLRSLNLPNCERDIIILADADEAGEAAAKDSARRWVREGRRVRIARPPRKMDFNDMLMAFRTGVRVTAKCRCRSNYGSDLPWR